MTVSQQESVAFLLYNLLYLQLQILKVLWNQESKRETALFTS
jgi:hypothetical protein